MARPPRRPLEPRLGASSACRFAKRRRRSRASPDRLESSSLSAALNPRAVPSVSRNFTVNASYCLGVTCTSSGSSEESEPLRACFGDAPNASRRSPCCSPLASDARRFDGLPAEGGDGFGGMAVWRGAESGSRKEKTPRSDSCRVSPVDDDGDLLSSRSHAIGHVSRRSFVDCPTAGRHTRRRAPRGSLY